MGKSMMDISVRIPVSRIVAVSLWISLLGFAGVSYAAPGGLEIEIRAPEDQRVYTASERSIEVEGVASIPAAISRLDLMLVMDTSRSLRNSDPYGHRIDGVMQLIDTLPERGDVRIGIVGFSRSAELLVPLTSSRKQLANGMRNLGRGGYTEISEGLGLALDTLGQEGRADAAHAVLVSTDGRSDADAVRSATETARLQGVMIHVLLLGSDEGGTSLLEEAARVTGGIFEQVKRSRDLRDKLSAIRTTGVEGVAIRINDSAPIPSAFDVNSFSLPVDLEVGENRIVATATSSGGATASDEVTVRLLPPGCGELVVEAAIDGKPAVSVSPRSVEIILDSSGSMWGKTGGRIKMTVAKQTLRDTLSWLPPAVQLGLRAYGHRRDRAEHDCRDTERLVQSGTGDRDRIGSAIAALKPKGQTPIAYALQQAAKDLSSVSDERAVVLLTDGIESCRGDAPAAARALQQLGPIPVHVIGFGMEDADAKDLERLKQIASASNGRYFTAANAGELRAALSSSVGTPYTVLRDGRRVANGTLGAGEPLKLPAGMYEVRLERQPTLSVPIEVANEKRKRLAFDRRGDELSYFITKEEKIEQLSCDPPTAD